MFSGLHYCVQTVHKDVRTYHVQPGYWDRNIRNPGLFMPRAGARIYRNMWDYVLTVGNVHRVYVESWNEYDEGSGIYAAVPGLPMRTSGHAAGNNDAWSDAGDAFEYIKTTRDGACRLNKLPDLACSVLDVLSRRTVPAGGTIPVEIVARNEGNALWRGAEFGLGIESIFPTFGQLSDFEIAVDDSAEVGIYGGVFRGRPVTFRASLPAPSVPGVYTLNWRMYRKHNGAKHWLGNTRESTIRVIQ